LGDILEGVVKAGASVTINIGREVILLKIKSVEMIDKVSTSEYRIGLLFEDYDKNEKGKLENIKLQAQIVDIFYNN
jgi:hypothetical protein